MRAFVTLIISLDAVLAHDLSDHCGAAPVAKSIGHPRCLLQQKNQQNDLAMHKVSGATSKDPAETQVEANTMKRVDKLVEKAHSGYASNEVQKAMTSSIEEASAQKYAGKTTEQGEQSKEHAKPSEGADRATKSEDKSGNAIGISEEKAEADSEKAEIRDSKFSEKDEKASVQLLDDFHRLGMQLFGIAAEHGDRWSLDASLGPATIQRIAMFVVVAIVPAMLGCIVYLYRERGVYVVCCIIAYLSFLTTIQFTVKTLTATYGFNYPAFITTAHFTASWLCGLCMMCHRSRTTGSPMVRPTLHEFSCLIVPLAVTFAAATLLTNSALLYCSIAYVQIIGSTAPLFSAVMTILWGLPFDRWLFIASCIVVSGTIMSVKGEVKLSWIGTGCALCANAFRAVKATMTQYLMQTKDKDKFDPCSLLTWMCFASIFAMAILSAVGEGLAPLRALAGETRPLAFCTAFVISCLNAAGLNFFALVVTKELGAVGQQISGQLKNVLCFAGGIVMFGDLVQLLEILGFVVVLLGVNLYQVFDRQLKEKMRSTKH